MKVIISPLHELDHYVSREFAYIIRDLIDTYGWKNVVVAMLHGGPGTLRDKLRKELGELPEVILAWAAHVRRRPGGTRTVRPGRSQSYAGRCHPLTGSGARLGAAQDD
jgi:hypothetical protein